MKLKTIKRIDAPGHAHALTFSCYCGHPWFESNEIAYLLIENLQRCRLRHDFDLWAYVIMPEHVHLLIMPRQPSYRMAAILASIKRPVAYQARQRIGRDLPHFWQPGGGYDRNLTEPKTVYHEIEYIHANPVRRGLCKKPEQYLFSSAAFWADEHDVPIKMDHTVPQLVP